MTRSELEHLIRAAGAIAEDGQIVVIGSQSVLGQFPQAPAALRASMEADLYPRNRPERAELVDGAIGEGSHFHEQFGYYAQGVGKGTAVLPRGWERRLVRIKNENTGGWKACASKCTISPYRNTSPSVKKTSRLPASSRGTS